TVLRQKDQSQTVGRSCIVGSELQRGAAAACGVVEPVQPAVHLGEVGVVSRDAGTQGDGPADQLAGANVVAELVGEHAQQVQGVGVVRLAGKDGLVLLRRLVQLPLPMVSQGQSQFVVHGLCS